MRPVTPRKRVFAFVTTNDLFGNIDGRAGAVKPLVVSDELLLPSTSLGASALSRVGERLGKGLRGPPRDAWLASVWKGLNVNGEVQGMYRYLGAAMQPADRLFLLDEVLGNLLAAL